MSTKKQSYTGGHATGWGEIITSFGGFGLFITLLVQGQTGLAILAGVIATLPLFKDMTR